MRGASPKQRAFVNWSGVHRAAPERWESPEGEQEICAALDRARRNGQRIRPIGSGHSWSAVAVPEEVALTLERHARVQKIDPVSGTITVQGGVQLKTLTAALDAVGMAMPILGSVSEQTIAGAISTGTHGSSIHHGNLASLVTAMRLVVPGETQARVLDLRAGDATLEAARVSLGALGVISEVTLRVVPAFRLVETVELVPTIRAADRLEEISKSAPFVKIWWLPGTGPMHVFRYTPTALSARESALKHWLDERFVNPVLFEAILRLAERAPDLLPPVNRVVARAYMDHPRATIARSDRAFNVAMPPKHRETEYALGFDAARWVLEGLIREVEGARYRVALPLEVRFVAADQGWLSPAYGEPVVQIGAYASEGPDLLPYFRAFESLAQARRARPHWGKECNVDAAYVREVFPRFDEFAALRKALDPAGVLRSRHLDRILG